MLEHFRTLLCAQPITGTEPELLDSFDAADPSGQLRTEQTGIGGFVSETAHGCKLLVDGVGGQMPRFQVHAIAHDHDAIEGQPRLRTIPGNELVDRILVYSSRCWRPETVEHRGLCNDTNLAGEALGGGNSALFSFSPLAAASHAVGIAITQTAKRMQAFERLCSSAILSAMA